VDRLSRDIVDLLTTVRDWLRAGVEVYALDIGQITSELDIVLVIKGWQGGEERQKIRERSMRGKRQKAKSGKIIGEGVPPYGYRYTEAGLAIHEREAQTVRMIFEWYINGDEGGALMSLIDVAARLTQMGIPSPAQSKGRNSPGRWFYTSVNRILSSETYYGVYRWGKTGSQPHILIDVPAIVSRETWELAQARRAYNSKLAKRKMKRDYLLRGLIFCGCGRRMAGTAGKYLCTRHYNPNGSKCNEPLVPGGKVECIAWDYIMGLIRDPKHFERKLREAQAAEVESAQPRRNKLGHVIALLKDTEREAEQIAQAAKSLAPDASAGEVKGIVAEKLQAQADEVDRRYRALEKQKAELEQSLELELTDATIRDFMRFREAVGRGMRQPTPEDKRRVMELLQARVTVQNQEATVTCRLGGKPLTRFLNSAIAYSRL
jgi:site-specific DNA recombinase